MTSLARVAERTMNRPFFLGYWLNEYATSMLLDDAALAAALGCTLDSLTMLRLCRAPRPDMYVLDLQEVANRFEANLESLKTCCLAVLHQESTLCGRCFLRPCVCPQSNPSAYPESQR